MKKSDSTRNGFVPVSRLAWSHPDYSQIVSSGLVLHLLMSANRNDGWVVTQTQREIAKMCGLSRQQVRTQLKKLVASGVVKISTEVVRNMRIDQVSLNQDHPIFASLSSTQTATQTATQSESLQTPGSEGGANPDINPESNPDSNPINKKDNKTFNDTGNKEKKEIVFEKEVKEVIALFNEKRLAKHSMRSLSEKVSTTELRSCLKTHGLADCLFVAEHYLGWAGRKFLKPVNCFRPSLFGNKYQDAEDAKEVSNNQPADTGKQSVGQVFTEMENETTGLNQTDTGDDVLNLSSCEDRQDSGADVALLTGGPLGRSNSGRTGDRPTGTHDGIPADSATLQEILPDVAA